MKYLETFIRSALLLASISLLGGCGSRQEPPLEQPQERSPDKVQLWEWGPYWAVKNIGAEEPWDSGIYFWWGDTVGYYRKGRSWYASDDSPGARSFNKDNAPTYSEDYNYNLEHDGWVVSKNGTYVLAPEHDAARVHWGGAWRMPTDQELKDLANKCDWEWTTTNGVYGFVIRGKDGYSAASIFLPAAVGYVEEDDIRHSKMGFYWSSVPQGWGNSWSLSCSWDHDPEIFHESRYIGQVIRPVQGFGEEVPDCAEVAKRVTHERAQASKNVSEAARKHGKVQLWKGGPYWADKNIGAENPEDYGLYFWCGDTVGYRREGDVWVASDGSSTFSFDMDNIPTYDKNSSALHNEGWIVLKDDAFVLAPEHDAARVHWGGLWHMPTKKEIEDLNNKCDWTWTTKNGVDGYIVSGRGDYSSANIFIPAAGYGRGTSLCKAGSRGYYWSSVPNSDSHNAYGLGFYSGFHGMFNYNRYDGQSVRPVQGFAE